MSLQLLNEKLLEEMIKISSILSTCRSLQHIGYEMFMLLLKERSFITTNYKSFEQHSIAKVVTWLPPKRDLGIRLCNLTLCKKSSE